MIPYSSCLFLGNQRSVPRRGLLQARSAQEKTKVTVGRRGDGVLCIEITDDTQENTEVEYEDKHLNISKSEHALFQKINLCDRRSHPIGQFKTLQRPKRNQPILKPEIKRHPGTDDSYSGVTQCILASAKQWAFNTFTLDVATGGRPLSVLLVHLFQQYGLIKDFQLDVLKVYKCFSLIEVGYHTDNPYHNAVHAADVTQAMHCFLQEEMIMRELKPSEIMASLLGAVCHDLDHPGVSQPFLIATFNHLAALYNNFSVLENHHWRSAISCLRESELLNHLSTEIRDNVEFQVRSLILATDITRQQEFLSTFKKYLEEKTLDLSKKEMRHFILQMGLKCADLCNPCRPWVISQQWSHQVCQEFYRQGDIEREMNLPVTPMFDRTRTSVARIQTDFFRYVVSPLFEIWDQFMNTSLSNHLMMNLRHNHAVWKDELERELAGREETSTTIGVAAVAMEECAPLASDEEDPTDECGSLFSESFFLEETLRTSQRRRYSMPAKTFFVSPRDSIFQKSVPQGFRYRSSSSIGVLSSPSFRVPSPKMYKPSEEVTASELLRPRTTIVSLSANSDELFVERFQTLEEVEKRQLSASCTRRTQTDLQITKPEGADKPEAMECSTSLGEVLPTLVCAQRAAASPTDANGSSSETDDPVKMHGDTGMLDDPVVQCNHGCCEQPSSLKCFQVYTKNAQKTQSLRQSVSSSIPDEQGNSQKPSASGQPSSIVSECMELIEQCTGFQENENHSFTSETPGSSLPEPKDQSCYVTFSLGEDSPDKEPSKHEKQTSWSTHVSRTLSEERPKPPSKEFDSPAPSLKGSTSSLTSINSRLTCRRGSAPMIITSSALSGIQGLSEFSDSNARPRASVFGRRWSIPVESVKGLPGRSESQNLKNKQDRSSHYRTSQKGLVRRHSFGLLVVPSPGPVNEGFGSGVTGTICSSRGNGSGQPGRGSQSSEGQDIFLPCVPPSRNQLAKRRGSLPADVPLSLTCCVQPVETPAHQTAVYGMESLQKLEWISPSTNPISRRNSMGEILQVLLGPVGSRFALQGLIAGPSKGQNTEAQDMAAIPGTGKQGLPHRGSGGLELISGFWRTKPLEKSPEPHATRQRMKLPQHSCSLDSIEYPDWLLQPGTLSHALCRNTNLTAAAAGFIQPSVVPNSARCQRRRGSLPINVPLLPVNSGESPSED